MRISEKTLLPISARSSEAPLPAQIYRKLLGLPQDR
jgi:hypothetical protein